MKTTIVKLTLIAMLALLSTASRSEAQLDPGTSGKPSVQSGLKVSLATPQALKGTNLNFSSPEALRSFSINFAPVMEMVSMLEGRGAKVEASLSEHKGLVLLNLQVDGKPLEPIVVECKDCIIVFEY
jgi:hypothetical protein